MRYINFAVVVLLSCVPTSVALQAMQEAVDPGKLFSGPRLDIRAPLSQGWQLAESGETGMLFRRRDESTGNTYVAEVRAVPLSAVDRVPDLLELAKQILQKRATPPRTEILGMSFESATDRPYPCVRFRATIQDTQARTIEITPFLEIHVRALLCTVPGRPDLLVNIDFSQRGRSAAPDLENLANSFMNGVLVHQGRGAEELRVQQLRTLAEGGNRRTQFEPGLAYAGGDGVPIDYEAAASWFRKAAEQGDTGAQSMLGAAYQDGIGVQQDAIEALKWWIIAGALDSTDAQDKYAAARDALSANMTADQRLGSQERADDWMREFAARKP